MIVLRNRAHCAKVQEHLDFGFVALFLKKRKHLKQKSKIPLLNHERKLLLITLKKYFSIFKRQIFLRNCVNTNLPSVLLQMKSVGA